MAYSASPDFEEATSLHRLFEARAAETPAKRAVSIDGRDATYRELDRMSDRVVAWLKRCGIPSGTHVAISLPISVEAVASVLGILKAGCVLVANHPGFSADKLAKQLVGSGAKALVTENAGLFPGLFTRTRVAHGLLIGTGCRSTDERLTAFDDLPDGGSGGVRDPQRADDPGSIAAIFYTTGSTFDPKGVVISHGNMVAALRSITSYLKNTPSDVILHYGAITFDFGLYNTLMPLAFGGTVVAGRAIPDSGDEILDTIRRERPTGLHFVPPVIVQLCNAADLAGALGSVRYLSSTAQALPTRYVRRLRGALPHVDLLSMYGMNEATRISYLPPDQIDARPTSVGKAIPGVRTYLVDPQGRSVERAGQVGELAVAGDLVMMGYWNLPEENDRVFRYDVFGEHRVFLTGDMFRTDAEGYLYYVSRKDDVFTRRTHQVNPKEIEAHLLAYPGVAEAVVVPVAAPGVGHEPRAHVVLDADARGVTAQALIDHCTAGLDWHMVPAEVVLRDSLPRTVTGKTRIRDLDAGPEPAGIAPGGTAMARLAAEFDDLATGRSQVPKRPVLSELLPLDGDRRLLAYHDVLTARVGPLFSHFLASVPYVLEELCRVGVACDAWSEARERGTDRAFAFYEADAFDGSNGRALNRYSDGRIATFTNSPNPSNEAFFRRFADSSDTAFFSGSFLDVDRALLEDRSEFSAFRGGFDVIYETATLQFYGRDRDRHVKHIADLLRPGGVAIFMHKMSHPDPHEFAERERTKDELFKKKYFSSQEIDWKRRNMLDQMHTGLIDLSETKAIIKDNFRHSGLVWNSGNFHAILASNDGESFERFLGHLGEPVIPPEFCVERLGPW